MERYSSEQVQAILQKALERRPGAVSGITREELLETARELGIDERDLEAAILDYEESYDQEDARERWKKQRKAKFFEHLRSYVIVNAILFVLDMIFTGGTWFFWPLFGWGIGLAFDAAEAFNPKEKDIDRGARKLMQREKKERARLERERRIQDIGHIADGVRQFVRDSKGKKIIIQKGDKRIEIG